MAMTLFKSSGGNENKFIKLKLDLKRLINLFGICAHWKPETETKW